MSHLVRFFSLVSYISTESGQNSINIYINSIVICIIYILLILILLILTLKVNERGMTILEKVCIANWITPLRMNKSPTAAGQS